MKAIFINAAEKTVTEINMENSLRAFYEQLQCRLIQIVPLGEKQLLILDEEGRCRKKTPGHFRFKGHSMVLTGHALVVSERGEDFGDARVSAEQIRELLEFPDLSEDELPKPKLVLVLIGVDELTAEGIAKAKKEACRKLAEEDGK